METNQSTSLWIASGNVAKAKELIDFSIKYLSGSHPVIAREPQDVVENEPTFEGNAKLKAYALAHELIGEGQNNFTVLADDSGLCVDLLGGNPGVYSGRYAGGGSNSQDNLKKVLHELDRLTVDMKKRTARYHCALYFVQVYENKIIAEYSAEGVRVGLIGTTPKGDNGYAYDSIFLDPQSQISYGEVSYDDKQTDSHRSRAFVKLQGLLEMSK
jgi:non-canonical purine NTP pyrophosphatase (RdgB/HAM1 family)